MNDIATVEVETSSPLFFDSYRQNRTTGSFIVIDPLTNATLGAGMIQAALSKSADALPLSPERDLDTPVANLERYQRHGHYPAVFSTTARPELVKRFERALFDEGFEAIVVDASEDPLLAAKDSWSVLYAAGFVLIYATPSVRIEEQIKLKAVAGPRYFDLDALNLPADDTDAAQHVLALAESLRIANEEQE
jgi:hypothetical protein